VQKGYGQCRPLTRDVCVPEWQLGPDQKEAVRQCEDFVGSGDGHSRPLVWKTTMMQEAVRPSKPVAIRFSLCPERESSRGTLRQEGFANAKRWPSPPESIAHPQLCGQCFGSTRPELLRSPMHEIFRLQKTGLRVILSGDTASIPLSDG